MKKMRRVISFQVIRNNLGGFRNRIAYFATDLKKVLLQLCLLSLKFLFYLQLKLLAVAQNVCFCSLLVVVQPTFPYNVMRKDI